MKYVAAVTALLGGHVEVAALSVGASSHHLKSGAMRGLVVSSKSPVFPEIPTLTELGYPIDIDTWYGLLAPAGTPKDIIAKLNAEVNRILNSQDIKDRTRSQGIELGGSTPGEFAAFIKADIAKWGTVIRDARITID